MGNRKSNYTIIKMNDNIKFRLQGKLEIASLNKNGEIDILYENHNLIETDAIKIITRCLTQVDFNKSIDMMEAIGNFPTTSKVISSVTYPSDNQIQFTCIFEENDFQGTVTDLKMKSSALELVFSSKAGLNITKDDEMRLRVKWQITIN